MMQHEFEERIGSKVTPEQYKIIKHVYMWHPSIPNVGGKEKIAALYLLGGMDLMQDMYTRACAIVHEYENTREKLKQNAGRMAIIGITMKDLQKQMLELDGEYKQLMREQIQLKERVEKLEGR